MRASMLDMTWVLPGELMPIAGVLALVLAWPRLRTSTSPTRLAIEILVITRVVVAGFAGARALYWWIEQRW